jgi:hypothetical protein
MSNNKIMTGIGSRATPGQYLNKIADIAKYFSKLGWRLRSGAAEGADNQWERNWDNFNLEVYLPWTPFNGRDASNSIRYVVVSKHEIVTQARNILKEIHPAYDKLTQGALKLHTRNIYQILGDTLDQPSDLVVYYAPVDKQGKVLGGTATAVALAKQHNIPTYNIGIKEELDSFRQWTIDSTAGP